MAAYIEDGPVGKDMSKTGHTRSFRVGTRRSSRTALPTLVPAKREEQGCSPTSWSST